MTVRPPPGRPPAGLPERASEAEPPRAAPGGAPEVDVWAARKLRHPALPANLRVLMPSSGAAGPLVMHKDAFTWGSQAQLFAGYFDGRPVVVRRLNALPPRAASGLRATLAASRSGRGDTLDAGHIGQDVRLTRQVARARGRFFAALTTDRASGGQAAKTFQLLEPMQADLLGVVHALAAQPVAIRQAVAAICIGRLAADLAACHAAGIAHRDVRAENLLLQTHPDGSIYVEGGDFGHARAAPPPPAQEAGARVAATQGDVRDLGRVALMLLQPRVRARVEGASLPGSLERVCREVPSWAALLREMVAGDQVSMAEVATRLRQVEAQQSDLQPQAFAVLHQVRHKYDDIVSCLGEISPWIDGLSSPAPAATPQAAADPRPPLAPLAPASWARVADRVRQLARESEEAGREGDAVLPPSGQDR